MSTAPHGSIPAFTIGDRLRKAREFAGLDQGQLADAMGVSRKTISNNEGGGVKPRTIVVRAWALATGVDVTWLETGEAPMDPGDPDGGVPVTSRYVVPQTPRLRALSAA